MPDALGVPGGMLDMDHDETIAQGWQDSLDAIIRTVANVAFLAATGDQVDRNLTIGSPERNLEEHQIKYENLFAPQILRSIPFAPAVGNHEARSNLSFSYHFNLPNEIIIPEENWVITDEASGRDRSMRVNENRGHYYFIFNNALFVVLNSSERVANADQAQSMITIFDNILRNAKNIHAGQYDWLFVHHHKTTAGLADHAADVDLQLYVEAGFERLMLEHNVDIVFAGHDHIYARSFPLLASEAAGSINGVTFDTGNAGPAIIQGDGTVFISLNSSTGQKFYKPFVPDVTNNVNYPYLSDGTRGSEGLMAGIVPWNINIFHQGNRPMFVKVNVNNNSVDLTAYERQANEIAVIDSFIISKNTQK
jgi:hypothetical protein